MMKTNIALVVASCCLISSAVGLASDGKIALQTVDGKMVEIYESVIRSVQLSTPGKAGDYNQPLGSSDNKTVTFKKPRVLFAGEWALIGHFAGINVTTDMLDELVSRDIVSYCIGQGFTGGSVALSKIERRDLSTPDKFVVLNANNEIERVWSPSDFSNSPQETQYFESITCKR